MFTTSLKRLYAGFFGAQYEDTEPEKFADRLNQFFREKGIGWEMRDGQIVYRGSEVFAETTGEAVKVLKKSGLPNAANEMHEALQDISRRPKSDPTGAIQHAMAALEATAREVTGKPNRTLGQLVPELDLPKPLDTAVDKLWGYACEHARHGKEGKTVDTVEAELLVSVACAVCTFVTKRDLQPHHSEGKLADASRGRHLLAVSECSQPKAAIQPPPLSASSLRSASSSVMSAGQP